MEEDCKGMTTPRRAFLARTALLLAGGVLAPVWSCRAARASWEVRPLSIGFPQHVLSDLPLTGQVWNLSCEYACTSAVTAYLGRRITQETLHTEVGTDENPHKGFRGDITGWWGSTTNYGVYAEPIAAVLMRYQFSHVSVSYNEPDVVRAEIAANHPVVAWVTGDYSVQYRITLWDDDEPFSLIPREHAVVVYGYDAAGVWVMDPSDVTEYHVGWATFDRAWTQFDRMALAIAP